MMTERKIRDVDPDEVDTDVINAYHLVSNEFSVSVQLADEHKEVAQSFLFRIFFDGNVLRSETLLDIDSQILSHVSPSPNDHVALDLGGTAHFFHGTSHTTSETPFDEFVYKLWYHEGGSIYLIGEKGTVCVAEGQAWRRIKPGAKSFLRAIHSSRGGAVHVAGDDGTLLRLSGGKWKTIPLNVNLPLNAIYVSGDGRVSIGCDDGDCFQYFEDNVDVVEGPNANFASICEFQGKRYWGDDGYGLNVQDGLKLVPFKALGYGNFMHATRDFLVVVGWKEVFLFDGSKWSGFEFEYNGQLYSQIIDMTRRYL